MLRMRGLFINSSVYDLFASHSCRLPKTELGLPGEKDHHLLIQPGSWTFRFGVMFPRMGVWDLVQVRLETAELSSLDEQRVWRTRCFGLRLDDKPREWWRSDKMGGQSCQILDRLGSILSIMISPSAKDCTEILPRRSYEIWHRSCIIGRYDILRLTLVWWNGDTFTGDPYEDLYTLWRLDETCHPRVVCCLLPKQLRSTIPIHGHFPNSVVWANFY